jgi:hypothetical protein
MFVINSNAGTGVPQSKLKMQPSFAPRQRPNWLPGEVVLEELLDAVDQEIGREWLLQKRR